MNSIDLSQVSAEELKIALAEKEEAQRKAEREKKVKFEQDKDDFITRVVNDFNDIRDLMEELKPKAIMQGNQLYERMYEVNGKEAPTPKTFQLKNESGDLKVQIDRQERFEFTEEAEVHINAIKDIFRQKFETRNKGFYNLLDSILMRNGKGDYDPKLLAKARKQVQELGDEELIKEFDKLQDCQRVTGSSLYLRAYQRDENDKWQDISLQFSSI